MSPFSLQFFQVNHSIGQLHLSWTHLGPSYHYNIWKIMANTSCLTHLQFVLLVNAPNMKSLNLTSFTAYILCLQPLQLTLELTVCLIKGYVCHFIITYFLHMFDFVFSQGPLNWVKCNLEPELFNNVSGFCFAGYKRIQNQDSFIYLFLVWIFFFFFWLFFCHVGEM